MDQWIQMRMQDFIKSLISALSWCSAADRAGLKTWGRSPHTAAYRWGILGPGEDWALLSCIHKVSPQLFSICYLLVRIGLQQLKHCHQTWQPSKSTFGFTPTWFNCTHKNLWINVRNQRWNIQIAHKIICIIKLFEIHSTHHSTAHGQWINISTGVCSNGPSDPYLHI